MEDRELIRLEAKKENIKKYIDKLYATTSVNAESNATEELIKEAKKVGIEELTKMAAELDIFGKCVFHYRLPIDMRLDINFSKATEVSEYDRKQYWKEYKVKLAEKKLNPEEEYNKIILMACTLHVPIKDEENVYSAEVSNTNEVKEENDKPIELSELDKDSISKVENIE